MTRRLLTRSIALVPAVALLGYAGEQESLSILVATQVVLSLQLPFAVVPLLRFTSSRAIMGEFANGRLVKAAGCCAALLILGGNSWLLVQTMSVWAPWALAMGSAFCAACLMLLAYVSFAAISEDPHGARNAGIAKRRLVLVTNRHH